MVERMVVGFADDYSIDLWIDEEGLLNGAHERIGQFYIGDTPIYGRGLIVFSDTEGESRPFESDNEDHDEFYKAISEKLVIDNNFNHA
jgi:hypothetical protein